MMDGLSGIPRAPIGKIIFRASGKVQMKVGDVLFDVSQVLLPVVESK